MCRSSVRGLRTDIGIDWGVEVVVECRRSVRRYPSKCSIYSMFYNIYVHRALYMIAIAAASVAEEKKREIQRLVRLWVCMYRGLQAPAEDGDVGIRR